MFELKPISRDAIPEALAKVERYRLLNEPWQAESICLDVLRIEPDNQQALTMLLLSLTDQFGKGVSAARAREVLPNLTSDYERVYYAGIISERWAESLLRQGAPGAGFTAYESLREAMEHYQRAEAIRPPGNDEVLLRWNTCARILMRNRELRPRGAEAYEPAFED
jgi:CHASE2 domain-containing sensor protein